MTFEGSGKNHFRVLIIEHSPSMRAACAHRLSEAAIDCEVCGDGEKGLALLVDACSRSHPFDGLLLDWLLPQMRGWEVLQKITADHRLDRVSVMIFTEEPDDQIYHLASQRPNNDIHLKAELALLAYRMRKFLTSCRHLGSMRDKQERQPKRCEQPAGSILFVDDSPTVCANYGDLLRHDGYHVLIAQSMAEALDLARRDKPDLALVDYFMPNGNGDELCRALLADERTRDVTVVMHSQCKDVIEDALNAGAIDLIWKDDPVKLFLLRTTSIMRTLRARRQAKDLAILLAATEALDVGLLCCEGGQWQEFNPTMSRFSAECGGLAHFIPDSPPSMHSESLLQPRRIIDSEGRRWAFNIHEIDIADRNRVVLVQDVTSTAYHAELLEQTRDKAMELAEAKSRFLANMSHEIHTPLNGVIGMLELLNGSGLNEEQCHFADAGIASAEALLGMIGNVLDFSKIDAGRVELEQAAFNLPSMIEDIVQMLAGKAAEKGLEMICDLAPEVPLHVIGDPGRLRQVLINLIDNAIKFTECGEIGLCVRVEHKGGEQTTLSFAVSDTGIGIAPNAQPHIFDAFQQDDNTTTRRFGGTGLGLAISGQLVQLMGGKLCLDSCPGDGSNFHFSIDMVRCGVKSLASLWNAEALAPLAGKRTLLIDDSPSNRLYLRRLCEAWNMSVEEAENGQRGLDLYERAVHAGQPFELVLLDRMMPEMDGLQFLQYLQRRDALPDASILLQASTGEARRNGNSPGISACLVKPIRHQDLLSTLCRVLKGDERQQSLHVQAAVGERIDGCRVLAVEDNQVNQQVLRGILQRAGCSVTLADDGSQALHYLRNDHFDLVLMDCEMPILDGYDATRQWRQMEAETPDGEPLQHQIIIALTAHTAATDRQKCLDSGMDDYLSKPVRSAQLLRAVKRWWTDPAGMQQELAPEFEGQGTPERPQRPLTQGELDAGPGSAVPENPAVPALVAMDAAASLDQSEAARSMQASTTDESVLSEPNVNESSAEGTARQDSTTQQTVIDLQRLNSLRQALGDIALVLETAIAELPRCLDQLRQAVEMGDAGMVSLVSHTMAGFLGNLGATEAVARARALEAHSKQLDLTQESEVYLDVERTAREAADALTDILANEQRSKK